MRNTSITLIHCVQYNCGFACRSIDIRQTNSKLCFRINHRSLNHYIFYNVI